MKSAPGRAHLVGKRGTRHGTSELTQYRKTGVAQGDSACARLMLKAMVRRLELLRQRQATARIRKLARPAIPGSLRRIHLVVRVLVPAAAALCLSVGILPFLWTVLERRFPLPNLAGDVAGIVVLGGQDACARIHGAADLAKRFPDARVVYSGGPYAEAEAARTMLERLGVEPGRITLEYNSRNTAENAIFSTQIAGPRGAERWLLVTSAFHMPRAIGSFRAAGFRIEAYPVDFRESTSWHPTLSEGYAEHLLLGAREFAALAAYWLQGYSAELFPGPEVR